MFSEQQNSNFDTEFAEIQDETKKDETPKRNSGRTGPTSTLGRETSSRNATVHGMCAKTLITDNEHLGDWLALLQSWLEPYQNPAEDTVLYTFVVKTAQAEWFRLRIQREFDAFNITHISPPISGWPDEKIKKHDLIFRYLTTAERRFQREYRMLEHHWKSHHKPQKSTPPPAPEPTERTMPKVRYINNETGESIDDEGNEYPPPPGYKSEPIIPGVYPPDHPAYEGPKEKPRRR